MHAPVWEQLATDQFDPWQVVPRQVFTVYSRLLISNVFAVVSRVGCHGVTGVYISCSDNGVVFNVKGRWLLGVF